MTPLILWHGELMSEDAPLASVHNRALRYGDGFFETMRVHNGRVVFFDAHWQRLLRTAKFLHLDLPAELSRDGLEHQVQRLCMANDIPDARVRLQLLRDGMGTYMPETLKTAWTMQCSPLVSSTFAMNIKGLTVGVYPNAPVPPAPIGNHKTLNALPYVLAAIHAKKCRWDDALLMNMSGYITEATGSNLFLMKGKEIITPSLSKGGLPGVMRAKLIEVARANGFQVMSADVTERDMFWADECILTNAINGMQWVLAYGQKRYWHRSADILLSEVNKVAGLQVAY